MSARRWPLCALVLCAAFASATPSNAHPAVADEPIVEWVRTGPDSVIEATAYETIQESATTAESTAAGPFAGVEVGDGFNIFGKRNYGDYIVRLVTSSAGDIEQYRDEAQAMVDEVNSFNGISMTVALDEAPGPSNPMNPIPAVGEIWVMIASNSPCGPLFGGSLGCGGVLGTTVIDGIEHWTSGAVWLQPSMLSQYQQTVVSHEIGHGLGLDHFNVQYEGQLQLMNGFAITPYPGFRSGDRNGVHWLSDTPPSNDSVAAADLVCGDSTKSASTWFATKEMGEPAHADSPARRSVWYKYVPRPEQNGFSATISTTNDGNADFNTVLDVYSGTTPTTPVTSNDDFSGTLSQVSFMVNSSLTYWIAVDGVGGVGPGVLSRGETDVVFDLPDVTASYMPLCTPARVLDTRQGGHTLDGMHQGVGPIAANTTYQLPMAGRVDIPAGAKTVVLNVTAVQPNSAGFLTVFPCGEAVPNASNLNFAVGDVVPNSVLARVGTAGNVCFRSSATTHLLVDVSGYFPNTDALVPLTAPARLLDTRPTGQTVDGQHQAVGRILANGTYTLPVLDRAGVPNDADTVVLNVTAVHPSAAGYLTVFPCGQAVPNASNLNVPLGGVVPNLVLARVGADGKVCFFTSAATDLLVDVSGYFSGTTELVPLTVPNRVLDTRPTGQTVDGQYQAVGRIAANTTYQLPINGRAGVPADAWSVVLNVTAVAPSAGGFLTVFACGQDLPNASNLNFSAGEVIANSVLARAGTGGKVCFYSSADTDLLVDVSGYFTP